MILKRLFLKNFRNYQEAEVYLSPHLNVFHGANAQGKTNLLESIYFLIFGRSFRTIKTSELIQEGASSFYIEADFIKHDVEQTLKISYSKAQKKIIYNSTEYSSFVQLLGLLQGVLLSPKDAELVQGPPQLRREFLDLQLAETDPLYIHHLMRYQRALQQRNVMLKHKQIVGIESFEQQLALSASYIQKKRVELLQDLGQKVEGLYSQLGGNHDALILNFEAIAAEKNWMELYKKERPRELYLGYTAVGPHRDDFIIRIESRDAKHFASEGQKRSCAAALRLGEWQRLLSESGEAPFLCIDDFGISLDQKRREKLTSFLTLPTQVFVSTADDLSKESFPPDTKFFHVQAGSVV